MSTNVKQNKKALDGEGGKVGDVGKVNCLMSHVGISRLMRIGRFKPTQGFCDQGRGIPAWVTKAGVVGPA